MFAAALVMLVAAPSVKRAILKRTEAEFEGDRERWIAAWIHATFIAFVLREGAGLLERRGVIEGEGDGLIEGQAGGVDGRGGLGGTRRGRQEEKPHHEAPPAAPSPDPTHGPVAPPTARSGPPRRPPR